ncbi:molybdate ABC transporter substrate-binding protein [Devosia geojensis]|uniref:Molybdate ABC transporter substrate-binding protein n=1 Tax=Devosia geojensis TaxID=443610 RepID=A0A0F5FTC1_9HYPH|nr:molybdate ABC transporter substrate-binding protein [Devosia geojensis]KKB12104.1 molybdate ABC transporter substrate-binding protein [Devosia geojensis]
MRGIFALAVALLALPAQAETLNAAVAANFTAVAEELAALFGQETGNEAVLSFGSTGQLYAQISQGAPFDVFLAADDERPGIAIGKGLAVEGTDFTYAVGRLVLYSPSLDITAGEAALSGDFDKLAIADPHAAPYGAAALETLEALDLYEAIQPKLVTGENISQTLQFVESGNAELGFVAASQVIGKAYQWEVPAELYSPIRQDAVLLTHGQENAAARAFLDFLRSPEALAIIEAAGYSVP